MTIVRQNLELDQLDDQQLAQEVQSWQGFYNAKRLHSAIGSPPIAKLQALRDVIPSQEEVRAAYDPQAEQRRYDRLMMERYVNENLYR